MKRFFGRVRIVILCFAVLGIGGTVNPLWAAGERLNIILFWVGTSQCETFVPGLGKRQVDRNRAEAGDVVVLVVVASDGSYNPCDWAHTIRVGVADKATLPFLLGNINETQPWDTLTLAPCPFLPGFLYAADTVRPLRATTHQRGVLPEILEYRFVVEDIEPGATQLLLPDTSSPLDSIVPKPYMRLLLVLPGEIHYPGDKAFIGKRGMPIDWNAGVFYDCWVYACDQFYNAVPFPSPPAPDSVYLVSCFTTLIPDSIDPRRGWLYTEVQTPDTVELVRKKLFKVRYPAMGYAGLKAVGIPTAHESTCERFRVTGPAPDPKDRIVVIPNPCGTPGLPAVIIIKRVPIEGGQIRGKIFDSFGYLVRDFSEELKRQTEENPFALVWRIEWDATNDKGKKVANGCYHFCVEITQAEWGEHKGGVWKEKIGVVW